MKHDAELKTFHEQLRDKVDTYAHMVYTITRNFPKEELYGTTSQLRRKDAQRGMLVAKRLRLPMK